MTNEEYDMLVRHIRESDLESGEVAKVNGQWYIEGKQTKVPKPIIKLSHWTEGTKRVVIDHQA